MNFSFKFLDEFVFLRESGDLVKLKTIINFFYVASFNHNREVFPEPTDIYISNIFSRLRDIFGISDSVKADQFLSVYDDVQVAGEFTDCNILQ